MYRRFASASWMLIASMALAQQPAPEPVVGGGSAPTPEAAAKIEEMLEGEEAVLQGVVSSYDPANRRDPFQSLLLRVQQKDAKRPEGVPGALIDEIEIRGIFRTSKGYVAQIAVQNQQKNYLVREGEQVYDGDVLRIEKNEVVFRQIVNDPTVVKPFREVVKKLLP